MTSLLNNPAFRRWFGDSKVVDASGEPLVVYHGTVEAFDAFANVVHPLHSGNQVPFGIHFAEDASQAQIHASGERREFDDAIWTAKVRAKNKKARELGYKSWAALLDLSDAKPRQYAPDLSAVNDAGSLAADRARIRLAGSDYRRVIPVYLSIRNPLDATAPIKPGEWTGDLGARIILTQEHELQRHVDFETRRGARRGRVFVPSLNDAINAADPAVAFSAIVQAGYDGVFHLAEYPGKRGKKVLYRTWVAFDPRQIKHATDNVGTYDPQDPNMYKNPRRKRTSRR